MPHLPPAASPPSAHDHLAGAITGLHGDLLHGWALDRDEPGARVALEVHVDGAFVTLARADQFQPATQPGHDQGDGFNGFAVQLNKGWLADARHVAVRIANQGPWLDGALDLPQETAPASPAPPATQVWYAGGLKVTGWAWDPDDEARHVTVVARTGDRVLARVAANRLHHALVYRPSADHGFDIDLPWSMADGELHEVHLEDDQGRPLSGSPIAVRTWPEGAEALLRRHWPGAADDPALELLASVTREQDRRAPRTVGFAHYPEWFKVFQQPAPLVEWTGPPLPRAGILLFGPQEPGLDEISLNSVRAQRISAHAVARAVRPEDIPGALRELLDNGSEAIVPLHAGDRLAAHALDTLLPLLVTAPHALPDHVRAIPRTEHNRSQAPVAWAYADCDRDGPNGERSHPWFKPAWDIELFLGTDIVTSGAIWGAEIVKSAISLLELDGITPGIQALTAGIAAASLDADASVAHLTKVIYHRRHLAKDESGWDLKKNLRQKSHLCNDMARRSHFPGSKAYPHKIYPGIISIKWRHPKNLPFVSIIIPTRDQYAFTSTCLFSLVSKTNYPKEKYEIILVNNNSTCEKTLLYMNKISSHGLLGKEITVIDYPHPFNYSKINNYAAEKSRGEILGFINNDIEFLDEDWLTTMVTHFEKDKVGAVGAKLTWPNEMTQHAGVVIGINHLAAHIGNMWHRDDAGYLGINQVTRNVSAVTAACLLTRSSIFKEIGGFDETNYPIAFNDVHYSLKVKEKNLDIILETKTQINHYESASRGKDDAREKVARSQREQINLIDYQSDRKISDPFYHPNLNHDWANGAFSGMKIL